MFVPILYVYKRDHTLSFGYGNITILQVYITTFTCRYKIKYLLRILRENTR